MSYYRAGIEDFFVGRVYEQQAGDISKWMKSIFSEDYLDSKLGYSYYLEILTNIERFKTRQPYYKIKHLDSADIESFGFSQYEDRNFSNEGSYIAYKLGGIVLLLFADRRVDIYEEILVKGIKSNEIKFERLFSGQLLDFNELRMILTMTGVLYDEKRKIKFNERV